MRMGARKRGFLQGQLCSKGFLGLSLLVFLVGLFHLDIAGRSLGSVIAEIVVPPADARRASAREQRSFDSGLRHPPAPVTLPAFVPSGRVPAFAPLPQAPAFVPATRVPASAPSPQAFAPAVPAPTLRQPATAPAFGAVPYARPTPSADVGTARGLFTGSKPVREESRRGTEGKRQGDVPHRVARAPLADTRVSNGGWDAMVRPTAGAPTGERLAPLHPLPLQNLVQPAARAHMPFHRLVEKLSNRSRQAPPPAKPSAAPPTTRPREAVTGSGDAGKSAARRLGARPPMGELLPQVGSFRSNEVLAVNLSAGGLGKVREGSYQVVERIDLPDFGLTLTRLRLPEDLNAVNGRDRLYDLLPEAGFTLNRVYAHYRPGMGRDGSSSSVAAQAGKGCPAERCFGSALINWQPRLAACARDVKVGVLDTGFDQAHPAFAGVRYQYKEFLPASSARASDQHGTGVLSLLAGNPNTGTPGLIPDASYAVANAFFADADGQPMSDTAQMLQALHWLKRSGVAVVNLSFAGPDDELLHHAVRELTKAGIVVVAAAGNEGPAAPPSYPAAYQEVIAVTAVDRNLAAYRYANRGAHIDIAAPGVDVWTAIPGRREGPQTGTSFAVPYVTAVVAVALQGVEPAPDGDPLAAKRQALAQLDSHIKNLGGPGRDAIFGAGLVQAPATCGHSPVLAVALNDAPPAQPWAGTVRRATDTASAGPVVVGSWVSTVHTTSRDGVAH
jgi:subtilase family protein